MTMTTDKLDLKNIHIHCPSSVAPPSITETVVENQIPKKWLMRHQQRRWYRSCEKVFLLFLSLLPLNTINYDAGDDSGGGWESATPAAAAAAAINHFTEEELWRRTISQWWWILSAIIIIKSGGCYPSGGYCLKLTSVDVPTMVSLGSSIWLNCTFDLENEELYSIKWYHWNANSEAKGEFYRWIPKDSPPGQMFQMEGIYLDLSRSSLGNVYLTKSDIYTDGSFRCEVSAEAPSFQTVRKEKELHIYSLPKEKPIIQGIGNDTSFYRPGDSINLTCRSKPSRPPATLTWHINGEVADRRFVKPLPPPALSSGTTSDGLQESRSQIYFITDRSHFKSGLIKITCISDIILQYTMSSEEIIIGGDGDTSSRYARNYAPFTASNPVIKDTPVITGYSPGRRYMPGDIVNLTCISRSKSAPKLSFLVNDEEPTPNQLHHSIHKLSDGSYAAKLNLAFRVKTENGGTGGNGAGGKHHHHQSSSNRYSQFVPGSSTMANIKQYRIKCLAIMEKNIYSERTEVHLGSSKQSSGLHFAENFALNINGSPLTCAILLLLLGSIFII